MKKILIIILTILILISSVQLFFAQMYAWNYFEVFSFTLGQKIFGVFLMMCDWIPHILAYFFLIGLMRWAGDEK